MAHNRSQKPIRLDVRFGSLADILRRGSHVRFTPESGHVQCNRYVRFVPIADIGNQLVLPIWPSARAPTLPTPRARNHDQASAGKSNSRTDSHILSAPVSTL